MAEQRNITWVNGQTVARLPGLVNGEIYYYVDDREGGRSGATPLEVQLWTLLFGCVPMGTNAPFAPAKEAKKAKRKK